MYQDRMDAGQQLSARLRHLKPRHPVVLALPRGGVPIGSAVARALDAPLGLVLVRKIGAPGQPELALGAVVDGAAPELVVDARISAMFGVSDAWLEAAKADALAEIERRRTLYLTGLAPIDPHGRVVIVVDDGIATGATMRAALRAVRRQGARHLVIAVPVASAHAIADLTAEADEVVCLDTPANFMAVGQFYRHFPQLADQEVIDLLHEAASFTKGRPA